MIRYVITAIKKDGVRRMAFGNNSYNTYSTREQANKTLDHIRATNTPTLIKEKVGRRLKVMPVEVHKNGGISKKIF